MINTVKIIEATQTDKKTRKIYEFSYSFNFSHAEDEKSFLPILLFLIFLAHIKKDETEKTVSFGSLWSVCFQWKWISSRLSRARDEGAMACMTNIIPFN